MQQWKPIVNVKTIAYVTAKANILPYEARISPYHYLFIYKHHRAPTKWILTARASLLWPTYDIVEPDPIKTNSTYATHLAISCIWCLYRVFTMPLQARIKHLELETSFYSAYQSGRAYWLRLSALYKTPNVDV